MMSVSSTFQREAGWYLGNIALFLVLAFGVLVGTGIIVLGSVSDDSFNPSRTGVFPLRVLEWALGGMLFLQIWIAPPVLIIVLTVYRIVVRGIHHPRVAAYLASAMFATLLVVMAVQIPNDDERWIVLPAAGAFAYAAILRLPGRTLLDLPPPVRGSVIGLSLSFIWFVGSIFAIALAHYENSKGRHATAGWILVSGTVLPATLFFEDLWRDDVPGLNYVITAGFVATAVVGLRLIAWSSDPGRLADDSSTDW